MATSGGNVTEVRVGRTHLPRQDNGGQSCGMTELSQVLLGIPQTPVAQCTISGVYMRMTAMP